MYSYQINIALKGHHYAKVELPQYYNAADALNAHAEFGKRFMPSGGWSVTLTRWTDPVGETMGEQR